MDRRSAYVLLAVIGVGVFLAGLELMVTAVALPSILADLGAPNGGTAWIELRKASWIINGYLLVYILTMPIAGRLADLWGVRRLFMGALVVFVIGSALAGASQTLDQLIAARLVQAIGGGVLVPVGTAAAAHLFGGAMRPRALGVVGALTFLGMAAGPVVGAAILASVHPETTLAAAGITGPAAEVLAPAWRWVFYLNIPIGLIALVLAWAASPGWETPRRPGRIDLAGAALYGVALVSGLIALTLLGSTDVAGTGVPPAVVTAILLGVAVVATVIGIIRGLHVARPVPRPAALPECPVQLRGARLAADRLCVRDRDHRRRGLRRSRPVRRAGRPAARARRARRGDGASARSPPGSSCGSCRSGWSRSAGSSSSIAGLLAMSRWTSDVSLDTVALGLGVYRARLRADRHAAIDRGGGGGGPACVRDGIGGRDGRPDARDGGRAGDPDRVRLDDNRPHLRRGLRDPRRVPQFIPKSLRDRPLRGPASWWARSRRGRHARRPRSWSGSLSWRPR